MLLTCVVNSGVDAAEMRLCRAETAARAAAAASPTL